MGVLYSFVNYLKYDPILVHEILTSGKSYSPGFLNSCVREFNVILSSVFSVWLLCFLFLFLGIPSCLGDAKTIEKESKGARMSLEKEDLY